MNKRHDTTLDGLMEQLIESGAENIGTVFARLFESAMQIERERFPAPSITNEVRLGKASQMGIRSSGLIPLQAR